jgi:hypothetical protein
MTNEKEKLEALLNSLKVLQDHSNSKDDKELYKRLVKSLEAKEKIDDKTYQELVNLSHRNGGKKK